jgi:hypothetical protein
MRIFFFVTVLISTLFLIFTVGNKMMENSTGASSAQSISTPEIDLAPGLYTMTPDTSTRSGDYCTFTGIPTLTGGRVAASPSSTAVTLAGRGDGQCGIGSSETITQVLFSAYNKEAFIELVR